MSLTINHSKVEALLRSVGNANDRYECGFGIEIKNLTITPYYENSWASGTISFIPTHVTEEARSHLTDLRLKIEKSGTPLISADDLAAEIRDIRRET
jgi:hypothetical protein